MWYSNILKFFCLNDTILINTSSNYQIINECFLQSTLSIPTTTLFLVINSFFYGLYSQQSYHVTSIQLKIYRLLATILLLCSTTKIVLTYFLFETNYTIILLINDLFQLISAFSHINLLLNKSIFTNLNFSKYPKSLLCVLILLFLVNLASFINQLFIYLYFTQTVLTNLILNGLYSSVLSIYIGFILLFYKLKLRCATNACNLTSEEDKANYISYITLGWLQNVMSKGYKRQLNTIDDLSQLPYDLNINTICKRFMAKYTNDHNIEDNPIINPDVLVQTQSEGQDDVQIEFRPSNQERVSKRTLVNALIRCFGYQFMMLGLIKLFNDSLNFAGPLLLNRLVEYIEIDSQDLKLGCMYAGGLFLSSIISSFLNIHFSYALNKLCLKIKCALIGLIYTKTVQIQLNELNNYSIGQIVNFMSIDSDTIVNVFPSIHSFWSLPFQILITLYLLYQQIGLSFLVGLGFVIILIPINKVLCDYMGKLHQNLMKFKDSRVKVSV
jgi:hypothetical protein